MEELIKKIYDEKLKDGIIEKIIGEQIDKMIIDCCKDLFTWNGSIKKQMQEKIDSVMSAVVKNSNFSDYVNAFTIVINQAMENTSLGKYNTLCNGLKEMLGEEETPKLVNLSDVFNKWCEWLETETVDYNDIDGGYVNDEKYEMSVSMEVEKVYSNSYEVRFLIENDGIEDEDWKKKHEVKFKLIDNPSYIYIDDLKLSDLRNMNKFVAYISKLNANFSKVEIDKKSEDTCVYLEVEY